MKNAIAGKVSYFILTFIFLIIIASFLFGGFGNISMGTSQNVAEVDGTPITSREYQTALTRQVEFFNQMMGGSGMTQKQMEDMGIKQSVLNGLIQQKLILNAADELRFIVSLNEIKNEIRNLPYFQTNNQFDVNLYRNMLQANGYIPSQFEELVRSDLKQKKIDELFNNLIVSENYAQDIIKFKGTQVTVQGVKISRQSLTPLISISAQEVKDFLAQPESQKILESAYSENLSTYQKPEEVKARHILIAGDDAQSLEKAKSIKARVNLKNFKEIAEKETQDPTGKSNGGDLGWFSAGRMVPEFEAAAFSMKKGEISEPVKSQFGYHIILVEDKKAAEIKTIESVKEELARISIQKTKTQDLDGLLKETADKIKAALEQNNFAAAESLAQQVNGQIFKNADVNQYDQTLVSSSLSPAEADQIFKASTGSILDFGNPGTIFMLKVQGQKKAESKTPEQFKAELASLGQQFSRKVRDEIVKTMNNKAKVVTNQSLL